MNFSYGIIAAVGILAAISIVFISLDPADIPEPRVDAVAEKPNGCDLDWVPVCGTDGKDYGNECILDLAGITLGYYGECRDADTNVMPEPQQLPMPATVSVAIGSALPGCEDADECYLPFETSVAMGGTVSWVNNDAAAHTVTSGVVALGPDEIFDSSLFMAGNTFEFTFEDAGTFDYYCQVHPWMTGVVNVQ